jgi:hypothetical protein
MWRTQDGHNSRQPWHNSRQLHHNCDGYIRGNGGDREFHTDGTIANPASQAGGGLRHLDSCITTPTNYPANYQKGVNMRFLLRVSFPVEAGNASAKKDGFRAIQSILQQQNPEAAYFLTQDGKRTGLLILEIEDASQLAAFAEPWFLALNAEAYWSPVMIPSDLQKAAPAIGEAVKSFG